MCSCAFFLSLFFFLSFNFVFLWWKLDISMIYAVTWTQPLEFSIVLRLRAWLRKKSYNLFFNKQAQAHHTSNKESKYRHQINTNVSSFAKIKTFFFYCFFLIINRIPIRVLNFQSKSTRISLYHLPIFFGILILHTCFIYCYFCCIYFVFFFIFFDFV